MAEWIISSVVLIVVVALVRQLLKGKISLRLQYALWAIVLVRLLVPITFGESKISVLNVLDEAASVVERQEPAEEPTVSDPGWEPIGGSPAPIPTAPVGTPVITPSVPANPNPGISEFPVPDPPVVDEPVGAPVVSVAQILTPFWLCGIVVVGLWFLFTNLRFWLRLRRSRRVLELDCPIRVYVTGAAETPCLFGLIRPAVYLTPEVAEDEVALRHVLAHELTHYRHWDHVWSVLRCVCLAVHWYNPLVWLAASLSRRDAELACDESTIRRIGEEERTAYGRTLIGLTCVHRSNLLHTATTMTGSKKSIKERIVLIAKKPKMAIYTLVAVILIAAIAVGCTFTGAKEKKHPFIDRISDVTEFMIGGAYIGNDYRVPTTDYEELLSILQSITEEQCISVTELDFGSNITYRLQISTGLDEEWQFYCLQEEENTVGVIFLDEEGREEAYFDGEMMIYPTFPDLDGCWLKIKSPELYQYIMGAIEDFRNGTVADADVPQAVVEKAEELMLRYLNEKIAEYADSDENWEFTCAMTGLGSLEIDTNRADASVKMYQMEYSITGKRETEKLTETKGHGGTTCLVFLDSDIQGMPVFVGAVNLIECANLYGTREMLLEYGDMYTAAAMELYHEWREENPEPANPADALRMMGIEIGVTLFERTWMPTHTLWLHTNSYDSLQFTALLQLLSRQSWVEVEQEVVTSDFRTTFVSRDGTQSLTIYSGSDGQVEYTCGDVTIRWRPAEKIVGADSDYALKAKKVYQVLEYHPNQVVQADDPLTAAKTFVESYAAERLSWSPGHIQKISDYRLLNWGLDEVSADGTAVVGWIEFAMLPDGNYDNFMVGGIMEGTGEYEGWVIDRKGFMLVRKDDLWSCYEWGGGMGEGTLEYHGYTPMEEWEIENLRIAREYTICQVDGSETDYNVIAQSLAEQYAQCILNRFGWTYGQALDVQVKSTEVFDAYYGVDNPNFCFGKELYIRVTEEQRGYWETGSGLGDPVAEGPYAGYYVHAMEVNARKLEDGNWHMTGMGTGGASVGLPVSVDYATTKQLVELYFQTEGFTHDWLIVYRLGETPVEEVRECLNELEEQQRQELTEALLYHVTTYPDYAIWKAEDL